MSMTRQVTGGHYLQKGSPSKGTRPIDTTREHNTFVYGVITELTAPHSLPAPPTGPVEPPAVARVGAGAGNKTGISRKCLFFPPYQTIPAYSEEPLIAYHSNEFRSVFGTLFTIALLLYYHHHSTLQEPPLQHCVRDHVTHHALQ